MNCFGAGRIALTAFVCFGAWFLGLGQVVPVSSRKTAAPTIACSIRRTPPSEADIAFGQGKYDDAAGLYKKDSEAAGAEGERAHNGLIRTLLRSGKVEEADKDASAWVEGAPQSSWARASLGEVQLREGAMDKAVGSMQAAGGLDRCNMQVHADFARFSELTGMNATAKRHLEVAHLYDPSNAEMHRAWLRLQPRSVQIEDLKKTLDDGQLSEKERGPLEKRREALLHPSAGCHLTTPVQSMSIPYQTIRSGPTGVVHWGLMVGVNGHDRRMEIDTGASGLLLSRGAAAALGLKREFEGSVGGIGDQGGMKSYVAKVEKIKIGGLEFENCNVTVLEADSPLFESADGLIGSDVFRDFLLTLDFPGRVLRLDPLPAIPGEDRDKGASLVTQDESQDLPVQDAYLDPSMKDWTAIFRVGHEMMLPVQPNNGPLRLFLVDTGADVTMISPKAALPVAKLSKGSSREIHGLSGEVTQSYTTGPIELHFAGLRYPTTGLFAWDTGKISRSVGVEVSGLLGAAILRRLTMQIDYRDDLVRFTYDPRRVVPCMKGVYREDCY